MRCSAFGIWSLVAGLLIAASYAGFGVWSPGHPLAEAGLTPYVIPGNESGFRRWTMWGVEAVDYVGMRARQGDPSAVKQLLLGSQFSDAGFTMQIGIHLYHVASTRPQLFLDVLQACPTKVWASAVEVLCVASSQIEAGESVRSILDLLVNSAPASERARLRGIIVQTIGGR